MGKLTERRERVDQVNELVKYIGSLGRRFFYHEKEDRYAKMTINQRGNLWWRDHFSDKAVYLHHQHWVSSRNISVGGTLKGLIDVFKVYVMKGRQIKYHLGPWPGNPNLWGYDEKNMELIRAKAVELGIHAWNPEDLNFTDTIEITPKILKQVTDTVLKESKIRLRRYTENEYMITITND